ncbi:MAG: SLC13 family permease, partial [Bryobacteraceae bacterium]
SNDATAVVLTPAVHAAVKRAGGAALPYLFICAFVANAASFVLPFSNPANLVIFHSAGLPPLPHWLQFFALPSVVAILATYLGLRWMAGSQLAGKLQADTPAPPMSRSGAAVAVGIFATAIVLVTVSTLGKPLGLPTFIAALAVFVCVLFLDRTALVPTLRQISWGILPLVAGLFVVVGALSRTGVSAAIQDALHHLELWPPIAASLTASFGSAIVCNIANNLPVGVLVGSAVQGHAMHMLRNALVIGIDLGPNFSVTGSLATILWLIALRREGERVNFLKFLKYGIAINSPALLLATVAVIAGS